MSNGKSTTQLEKDQYVTTPAGIKALVKEKLTAVATSVRSNVNYLRALVATTQAELGSEPHQRSVKMPKLTKESRVAQLTALEAVHEKFYGAVLEAIEDTPLTEDEKPTNGRTSAKAIVTRRATFARTAKSTVRAWIKAGHDITALAAAHVTKPSLTIPTGQKKARKTSPKVLVKRATSQSKELVTTLVALSEVDPDAAKKEFQVVMGIIADQMGKLGVTGTKDASVAAAEHIPLIQGRGRNVTLFMPTATQVIRQAARPS